MAGKIAKIETHQLPYSTRFANRIFSGLGYRNRLNTANELRTLSALPAELRLNDILKEHNILKPGFSGDLAGVRAQDIRWGVSKKDYEALVLRVSEQIDNNFDPASMQLPSGLSGLPSFSRILIGLQVGKQLDALKSQSAMQESLRLIRQLDDNKFVLTPEIQQKAKEIVADIRSSAAQIEEKYSEVRASIENLAAVFEKYAEKKEPFSPAEQYEMAQALGEINGIVSDFRWPEEAHSPNNLIKFGSSLSKFLTLGFMFSVIYLGTKPGYFTVDRAFYFTAAASLGLFSWAAHNFMKIASESENIPNLEFSTEPIPYKNLPREVTKRFSNGGLAGGISALLQDYYLNVLTGNHDTILNNDPNNSFYQGTYGDAKQIWRVEKRAAKIEKVLRDLKLPLNHKEYERLAAIMAMEERSVPAHYSLLEAAQDMGISLGKTSRLLYKIGERGAEYACYDAAVKLLEQQVPNIRNILLPVVDRLNLGTFLSGNFETMMVELTGNSALVIPPMQHRLLLVRDSLVHAAMESKIDRPRAELWADKFIGKVQSEARMTEIAELSRDLLYHNLDATGQARLAGSIGQEFGLPKAQASALIETIATNHPDLELNARALNRDHEINLTTHARLRDLVKVILFHERTNDARVHEEGAFGKIAGQVLANAPGSYLAKLLHSVSGSDPANFLTIQGNGKPRLGSLSEKLFLSFVARGIGEKTSQVLADSITDFMATRYLNAEAWEADIVARGRQARRWEAQDLMLKDLLANTEQYIRSFTASPVNGELIPAEKVSRAIEVTLDAIKLHEGIFNRTVDGYLSEICQDAEGIRYVSAILGTLPEFSPLQKSVLREKVALQERKRALARVLRGNDNFVALAEIDPVIKAINELVRKGIGELRAEARFQDGHLLSFDSLKEQVPDILLGKDKMHRTMPNKTNRYQSGEFQQYEIEARGMNIPKEAAELTKGVNEPAFRQAATEYVEALSQRYRTTYQVQDLLRRESRRLDPSDPRLQRIHRIKTLLTAAPGNAALLKELHALESQIHQTRERIEESAIIPFADVVIQEMENGPFATPIQRVIDRSTDIIIGTIEKESQKYGLAGNGPGKQLIKNLRSLMGKLLQGAQRVQPTETNNELWRTCLFFERMNYEKWKGSKGANNDSGLGFYLGERIGVKLYHMLEYMSKDKILVPPDILARISREFNDLVRLNEDFTLDQRAKEQLNMFPEPVALSLIDSINSGSSSKDAVEALVRGWAEQGTELTLYEYAGLYKIASEIAIRVHGHKVLGYVAARDLGQRAGAPNWGRAQYYLELLANHRTVKDLIRSLTPIRAERRALMREAALLKKRIAKNDRIINRTNAWLRRNPGKQEEYEMRLDRRTLFHPDMPWFLIPAINQPFSKADRKKQFIGERLQERRREFIIPYPLTAEETAARMMTMSNNRMPMKKIEKGFVENYGAAFLEQAREVDRQFPGGIFGRDIEKVAEHLAREGVTYLDSNRFERPVEIERDVVRDVDTDNFLFESSQRKANAYWKLTDSGKVLRSYSAILQTQQYYPESHSRLSSTQNEMGLTYSTLMGKAFGKRGKQVIMGCYIVKNRRALSEITDWIEIPFAKRAEAEMFDDYFSKEFSGARKDHAVARYKKLKLFSEYALAAVLAGVGGTFAFSPAGLLIVGGAAAGVGLSKLLLTKGVEKGLSRAWGYGLLAGTGALVATAIAAGLAASPWAILGGIGVGLIGRGLNLWFTKSELPAERAFGKLITPITLAASAFVDPLSAFGTLFGLYHADDMAIYLPYHINYDTRKRVADALGIDRNGTIGKWLLKRQKMTRMYEEEEAYSQPDDVEDFGSSPGVFQRGYHSDFHQSIDGISDDVKDKGTLDGQRGRWHGGMEGNFRPAMSAYLWDRQAMGDIDWMRYILQTIGPAGSFARLGLNFNLWSFLGTGATAFMFGLSSGEIVTSLAMFSAISVANYITFLLTLGGAKRAHGSNHQKTSDMLAILDALSPTNVYQGIMRMRYGETPPFLVTKSPHEQVSTPNFWPTRIFPFWPVTQRVSPTVDGDKYKNNTQHIGWNNEKEIINSVLMANRIRFGYILGTLGVLALSIPGIAAGEMKSLFMLPLMAWTGIPIYYASRGLNIIGQGSSPLGTFENLRNDGINGQSTRSIESRRKKLLKKGLKKSAFKDQI